MSFLFDAIERLQCFTGPRLANDQATTFEQVEIEHVGRLAALPENIVGGVDGVADRTLVDERKAIGNMRRRWLDLCAANFARRKAGAEIGLLNIDQDFGLALRSRQFRFDRLEREIVESRSLAGYAVVVHSVGTVGRDLHLVDRRFAFARDAFDRDAG